MADLEPLARAFEALAYRAHNPRWAYLPTSGEGAARHGGRFNRRGVPALYLSLDLTTAWLEAQQGLPFKAQPMTLVAYRVCCRRVADVSGPDILAAAGVDPADLACAWEDLAGRGAEPPSWRLADALIAAGFQGAIVPSFAPAPNPGPDAAQSRNLVLWRWSPEPPCAVQVIDDLGRLPRDDRGWDRA
jgi:RES domain-containing protein